VGREVGALPLLLVATYRGEEIDRQHPLSTHLPLLVREARALRLDLQPLDRAALRALLGARYALLAGDLERLTAYLQARAEGNPSSSANSSAHSKTSVCCAASRRRGRGAVGIRRCLGVGLPVLLRQVLDRRLARLEEDDHGLLAVAAVIARRSRWRSGRRPA